MKKCKSCRAEFKPWRSTTCVCSPACAQAIAQLNRAKAEKAAKVQDKRETKARLDKLKSKADYAKDAQMAVNAFIRLRDEKEPCISCGRYHQGQYHAGHYLSRGARPELRFEELNIHRQCAPCNNHKGGNVTLYRIALVEKIGIKAVEWLEGPHEPRRDTVESLVALKREYAAKVRELRAAQ